VGGVTVLPGSARRFAEPLAMRKADRAGSAAMAAHGAAMRIEYHRTLLADRVRNGAFFAALQQRVIAGTTTVADIGAGTGFLGFLAARLGAKRVDLYEVAEIAGLARKLIRRNQLRNCRIAAVHSTEVVEPDRVDVVVCEALGNYPFEENIIATLNDARRRYLKVGGAMIPQGVRQFVCPVIAERLYRELAVWDVIGFGLDFAPAKSMSLNNIYVRSLCGADLLEGGAAAKVWDEVSFLHPNKTTRAGEAEWRLGEAALICGLALWWSAELAPGVTLSTSPAAPATHWEQLYLPVLVPIAARRGQTLSCRLRSTTSYGRGTNVTWTLTLRDASGRALVQQALDLERGYLP
jgi:protein arginine N-methyltransferase 1